MYRGNGLLLFDTTTNTTTQVFGDINFGPAGINDDGSRVSFAANSSVWLAICPAGTDLSLTKTDSPDPVLTGKNLTYTLTVSNAGPSAVGDAVLNDPLPANTTFQSLTAPAGWSCTTPAVGSTGTVDCGPASLAAGATASFTLVVKVSGAAGGTTLSNTATVTSSPSEVAWGAKTT